MTQIISTLPAAQTTAAMVAQAHDSAVETLVEYARRFQDAVAYARGIAGDGNEVLDAPGVRRVYVRVGGENGELAEARYDQFKPTYGNGVYMTRERVFGAGGYLIVGQASGDDLPCAE